MRGQAIRSQRRSAPAEIAYVICDIHLRKEQQEKVFAAHEHEQIAAIVQASEDCVCVIDPDEFRLIAFNKSFEDLMRRAQGIRVKLGMRAGDIAPEHADRLNSFCRRTLAEGKIRRDYPVPSLKVTYHVFAQCLVRDGRVYGIGLFGHDVTNRKQMEAALRRSEEKFAKAFRDAPMALTLTSTRDDRYMEVNDAFVETTGYSREELIGKTPLALGLCVQPEKRAELVNQVVSSGEVRNIEILYRTKSGEIRESLGSAVLVDIESEPCVLSVILDTTERKRALEALQESEERLRIAIDAGHMYTFEWDLATDIVKTSEHGTPPIPDSANYSSTKQALIDRIHPDDRQKYALVVKSLTPENPGYKTVFRLTHHDGRTAWLEESGRAIFGPDGKLRRVIGIVSDVTDVRQSERALRELSRRLISSQEEERRRIARELHDHIGQEAALICVQAQRIDTGVADEEHTTRSDVHELYKRIKGLSGDVSKLSHRLHSSELSFLGLSVAAERLCRDIANQYGIDVDYQAKSLPSTLDSSKSLCFYRVLQEALQNVVKHSHASQVIVELQGIQSELTLKVRDNGSGFDVERTGFESGLGLISMRERLNLIGGRFAIASKLGSGTKLTANVTV